jgi:hypothetical protein
MPPAPILNYPSDDKLNMFFVCPYRVSVASKKHSIPKILKIKGLRILQGLQYCEYKTPNFNEVAPSFGSK